MLDEVRLDPDGYRLLVDRSLLTALARNAATAVGVDVSPWAHQTALERERRRRGLLEPDQVDDWLEERGLSRADLPAVARRLAVLRWAHEAHRDSVAGEVALTVRSDDVYARARRARRPQARRPRLASDHRRHRQPRTARSSSGTSASSWDRRFPSALDAWASAHGWGRVTDLLRALRAEWLVPSGDDEGRIRAGRREGARRVCSVGR